MSRDLFAVPFFVGGKSALRFGVGRSWPALSIIAVTSPKFESLRAHHSYSRAKPQCKAGRYNGEVLPSEGKAN